MEPTPQDAPARHVTGLGERLVWAFLLWLFVVAIGMVVLKVLTAA